MLVFEALINKPADSFVLLIKTKVYLAGAIMDQVFQNKALTKTKQKQNPPDT